VGAGAIKVFMEHASGATQARARWQDCLEHLQPGNILVVELDQAGVPHRGPVRYRHGTRDTLEVGVSKPIGYARVSTRQQSTDRQWADLLATGVRRDDLYVDQDVSGARPWRP
jgi:DNA invertase Pin-like site-specific DNA recombinase